MSVYQNGLGSVLVSWAPGEPIVTGYIVFYQQESGGQNGTVKAGQTADSISINGLIAGATYSISVVAMSNTLNSVLTDLPDFTLGIYCL